MQYYVGVPESINDGKGAGPFMYAAAEYDLATAKPDATHYGA
jgi:hypothetical protein